MLNLATDHMTLTLGFLGNIGWPEMLMIGAVMLLLFGSRLPEVGKSLGKGIIEFKKGLKSIDDDAQGEGQTQAPRQINAGVQNMSGSPAAHAPGVGQTVSRADVQ